MYGDRKIVIWRVNKVNWKRIYYGEDWQNENRSWIQKKWCNLQVNITLHKTNGTRWAKRHLIQTVAESKVYCDYDYNDEYKKWFKNIVSGTNIAHYK